MLVSQSEGLTALRRRRSWSAEEKRRIVAETFEPGASVSIVARRHDLNANMLFNWRRQVGSAAPPGAAGDASTFVPADGVVAITASQLGYMLDGIDWRNPQRTWRPAIAG